LAPIDFGSGAPDLGILMQSTDDDKDWKIINKATPTGSTGPKADHSTGRGYYAYLEASGIAIGSRVCFFGVICSLPLRSRISIGF